MDPAGLFHFADFAYDFGDCDCASDSGDVAAGVDGIFLEVHDNPKEAKSDGANALDLKFLRGALTQLLAVHKAVQ